MNIWLGPANDNDDDVIEGNLYLIPTIGRYSTIGRYLLVQKGKVTSTIRIKQYQYYKETYLHIISNKTSLKKIMVKALFILIIKRL